MSSQVRDEWSWVHPEAKLIIGVNWKAARASQAGEMIARKMKELDVKRTKESSKGIEFLETVDRILISTPETPGAAKSVKSLTNPSVLIYMQGTINRDNLKQSFGPGTATERYKGLDLFLPPPGKAQGLVAALVSESVVVLGDRPSVERALAGPQTSRNSQLLARVKRMQAECDIWMVTDEIPATPGAASPVSAAGVGGTTDNLNGMKAMDLGVSLRQDVRLRMNMVFPDAEKARGMATMTQLMASMASSDPKRGSPAMRELAKSLNVQAEGASVRLTLDVPLATLEEGVDRMGANLGKVGRSMAESMIGGGKPAVPAAGDPNSISVSGSVSGGDARTTPKSPERNTIRIYGMEGGVKEIPLEDSRKPSK